MQRACANGWCGKSFEITDEDLAFYDKVSPVFGGVKQAIPVPTLCPSCRHQRRAAWRNQWTLYGRECDLCRKRIVSIYPGATTFPVYCNDCWWSDRWDPLSFARPYRRGIPFFEQWRDLRDVVPRNALYLKNAENSDYCNHAENLRNCYLSASVGDAENIYHSEWIIGCRDLCDCYQLEKAELCYESQYSVGTYNCRSVVLSDQCRNSSFLYDCTACEDCFACWNLRHKQYCVENVQYTRDEYEEFLKGVNLGSTKQYVMWQERFRNAVRDRAIRRDQMLIRSEECSGDLIYQCKNVRDSYIVFDSQDCRYCYCTAHQKDSYDAYESAFDCELQYDTHACNRGKRVLFGNVSYDVDAVAYVDSCHNSSDLFGCVGLRRQKHCILNTRYSPEEYEQRVAEIIADMRGTHEWGEFPPVELSPFAYNETMAQIFSPLTKEQVLARTWRWKDPHNDSGDAKRVIDAHALPDALSDIPDDVLQWAIRCEVTGRLFRVVKPELSFYRTMNVPVPHLHPEERYRRRVALRNTFQLWPRQCARCSKAIQTTYAPERPEIVYCEECYLKEVY